MSGAGAIGARWSDVRYRRLLPLAGRSRRWGRGYAALVAAVELARDPGRRTAACQRIERCLGVSPRAARRTFLASLQSEAREEGDTVYFAGHDERLARLFAQSEVPAVTGGATILVTLHFGSPILGYLCLRRRSGLDCTVIARPLDEANPMPEAKRAYARRKVAWVERVAERPFLATDAASIARARERLVAGRALYTPIDVPGDVAARRSVVTLLGARVQIAAGVTALARLTGSALLPVVTIAGAAGLSLRFGRPVAPASEALMLEQAMHELEGFIRAVPSEWWMWPYLWAADRATSEGRPRDHT